MPLCSLEEALDDLRAGKLLIVVDDENRENEGDLVMPPMMSRMAGACSAGSTASRARTLVRSNKRRVNSVQKDSSASSASVGL